MRSVAGRIRGIFGKTDADAIIITNTDRQDSNFSYLTGFTSGVFEGTVLIVTRKGMVLPVSRLEYETAIEQRPREMQVVMIESRAQLAGIIKRHVKSKSIGINGSFLPYKSYMNLKKLGPGRITDVSHAFYEARSVKDASELKNITEANRIVKRAIEEAKKSLREGITEREFAGILDFTMMKLGASGAAFSTIVAFDRNAALPHHMPNGTRLRKNCIVLVDAGAKYNNYCSDITRTFVFRPDKKSGKYRKFLEMYGIVKESQRIACGIIKDGVMGSRAHNSVAEYIDGALKGRYKGRFIHSLGHAIGIDVHDPGPGLYANSKERLKANMVVSNEPGIYVVGFGGVRIEDDVIVTKTGCRVL
ncbi:MAG: aminopeptidase P family protein [Candidatus Micrarchaeota archaeon]|nr:aminopeptidase P family protein [Candidatus Micrarchaeota archaeon]